MIEILLGNDLAVEGYRDPNSDEPEKVRYRPQEGQHTTQILLPEPIRLQEAFFTVVGTAKLHMEEGAGPVWVEGDNEVLVAMLKDHWQITQERPKNWGKGKTVRDREAHQAEYARQQAEIYAPKGEGQEEE